MEKDSQKIQILVAEDNQPIRAMTIQLLEKMNFSVDAASNGYEVLEALKDKTYEIIFLDCQMPELNGFETVQRIRTNRELKNQPWIIAITGNILSEERQKCFDLGMNDFMPKPFNMKSLKEALSRSPSHSVEPKTKENEAITASLNRTKRLFSNDEEILSDLIKGILNTYPDEMKSLARLVEAKDCEGICKLAHKIRGGLSSFFYQPLENLLLKIEDEARAKQTQNLDSLFFDTHQEFSKFLSGLRLAVSKAS